jgi:hypothetical protein
MRETAQNFDIYSPLKFHYHEKEREKDNESCQGSSSNLLQVSSQAELEK